MLIPINEVIEITQKLEPLYQKLPATNGKEPWEDYNCVDWSDLALPIIRAIRPKVQQVAYDVSKKSSMPGGFHEYIADWSDPDDPVVFDGTYQQFNIVRNEYAPHILICSALQSTRALLEYGVDPKVLPYWRVDLYYGNGIRPAVP